MKQREYLIDIQVLFFFIQSYTDTMLVILLWLLQYEQYINLIHVSEQSIAINNGHDF